MKKTTSRKISRLSTEDYRQIVLRQRRAFRAMLRAGDVYCQLYHRIPVEAVERAREEFNKTDQQRLVLHLVLTHQWYDEVESGAKCIEYRQMTPRWMRVIYERRGEITHVRFSRGYTRRTITRPVERIDIGPCPIPGWDKQYFRIHFLQNMGGEG